MKPAARKPQEYQQLHVFFNDVSRKTRAEKMADAMGLEAHCYFTFVDFLAPTKILPEVNEWMHRNLPPGEKGSPALIDFLREKGALLHSESGPAYSVTSHRVRADKEKILQEEYWLKGQRVSASAVVSRVNHLNPGNKMTF